MIRLDKDPTLDALLRQQALKAGGYYIGALDNWWGPRSQAALENWRAQFLTGDGTWKWIARIEGDDILLEDVSMTWFGGDNDPLDNGETASGIVTKGNPELRGVALPVIPGHPSTKGSPLAFGDPQSLKPGIPWRTAVQVSRITDHGSPNTVSALLIDNGPAKSAGDPVDATVRLFTDLGGALSEGVLPGVTVRILGAAKFARAA